MRGTRCAVGYIVQRCRAPRTGDRQIARGSHLLFVSYPARQRDSLQLKMVKLSFVLVVVVQAFSSWKIADTVTKRAPKRVFASVPTATVTNYVRTLSTLHNQERKRASTFFAAFYKSISASALAVTVAKLCFYRFPLLSKIRFSPHFTNTFLPAFSKAILAVYVLTLPLLRTARKRHRMGRYSTPCCGFQGSSESYSNIRIHTKSCVDVNVVWCVVDTVHNAVHCTQA